MCKNDKFDIANIFNFAFKLNFILRVVAGAEFPVIVENIDIGDAFLGLIVVFHFIDPNSEKLQYPKGKAPSLS